MKYKTGLSFAEEQDRNDPLRKFRKQFHLPRHHHKKAIYFCGNSLGPQPKSASRAIRQELKDWKNMGVAGYFNATNPWLFYQDQFKGPLSRLTGAAEDELTVMNTLTVNLHLLMLSFYRPVAGRYKIIMEAGAFPSDQYAARTQAALHGHSWHDAVIELAPRKGEKTLRTVDIIQAIETNAEHLSLVLMGGINYYTGQLYDMGTITAAVHKAGAIAGFDLAHAIGNLPLHLHKWNLDFAVWCSYKYLNGGPGAVGGIFIHSRHAANKNFPRMGGWWGNAEKTRFRMEKTFRPKAGAGGWQLSTAQVFNMAALKASLKIFDHAGIKQLHKKSLRLTGYLEFLLRELKGLSFNIITPSDPAQRGAQLSLYFKRDGKQIHEHLMKSGVVVDYREPGVIRVAPAPLYNSFREVYRFISILQEYAERNHGDAQPKKVKSKLADAAS